MNYKPGYRIMGQRKLKLVMEADRLIMKLTSKGVNIKTLKQIYGIDKTPEQIPTKKWTGIISSLHDFAKSNGIGL